MTSYDIFNGDADGICALVQLRRAEPRAEAVIVTGVKRDIALLDRVDAKAGDHLTVLDVSMRTNAAGLRKALAAGAEVFYVDHHNAGDIPEHPNLRAVINTAPTVCTSVLVNACLNDAYAEWAAVGAFGDNFPQVAERLLRPFDIDITAQDQLQRFGILINYNAYGAAVNDLHISPDTLYHQLVQFDTPQACLSEDPQIFDTLDVGYRSDMAAAKAGEVLDETTTGLIIGLPDAASSRRVSGVYGNQLAQDHPSRAHAILTHKPGGGYLVSVRAPLSKREGADTLCLQFETGGGRAAAAGINHLPSADLERFIAAFQNAF